MSQKIHALKPAETPVKQEMLDLLDQLRAEVENGVCLSLVTISIGVEETFRVRVNGDVTMTRLAGLLGRAQLDCLLECGDPGLR
jgi:hypothetical protein